jgi:hypothetical protein
MNEGFVSRLTNPDASMESKPGEAGPPVPDGFVTTDSVMVVVSSETTGSVNPVAFIQSPLAPLSIWWIMKFLSAMSEIV